ncbi:MAG: carbohydrate kinase family protein [Anaerolineales bacterium]
MTALEKPIVCLGILVADVIGRPLRSIPAAGSLVLVDEMSLHTGGCAANAATALAKLDLPVEAIGKVGEDPFGDFVIDILQERGIGTRGVKRDAQVGTSVTMVLVDPDGERRFVHYIGANASLTIDDIDFELISGAAILHIGGSLVLPGIDGQPTANLLKQARQAGVITFLDTVWDDTGRWMTLLEPSLPYIDYFIPSLPEAQAITGIDEPEMIARLLIDQGVRTVALKMGPDGCLVMTGNYDLLRLPAFDVEVVDATGAGDAFAAGFMTGIWQGWSLDKTARFASAVGAMCVTGVGAAGCVSSLEETLKFMETMPLKN